MLKVIFFDSWGTAWTPCRGDDPGAKAFGPSGVARKLSGHELYINGITPTQEHTSWGMAKAQGRLIPGEWDTGEWDTFDTEKFVSF